MAMLNNQRVIIKNKCHIHPHTMSQIASPKYPVLWQQVTPQKSIAKNPGLTNGTRVSWWMQCMWRAVVQVTEFGILWVFIYIHKYTHLDIYCLILIAYIYIYWYNMYSYIYNICRDILKWGILKSPLGINNNMVQSWPFWHLG